MSIKTCLMSIAMLLLFLLLLTTASGAAQVSGLKAGTAQIEITPPAGLPMAGYAGRQGNSRGVLDPLYLRVIVLAGKESNAAFVTFDLIGPLEEEEQQFIRRRVKESRGVEQVIFNGSHTHSGPSFGSRSADKGPTVWVEETMHKTIAGIEEAYDNLAPASVAAGYGQAVIGQNRRFVRPNGDVRMIWNGPIGFTTYPVDPTVGVIRFDDMSGKPIAILVNYACHPVTFAADNLQYSADYPGAMMRYVKEHVEGNPMCMFVQGALGNINPVSNPVPLIENAVKIKNELGVKLGREVVRVALNLTTHPVPDAVLLTRIKEIPFSMRWNEEKLIAAARERYGEEMAKVVEKRFGGDLSAPLSFLVLKGEFGICGFPGEFFVEFQMALREKFSGFPVFFAGYTGKGLGYFPTIRAAVEGGYGANSTTTVVEVGAGERLVDEAVVELYYMTGKLAHEQSRSGE